MKKLFNSFVALVCMLMLSIVSVSCEKEGSGKPDASDIIGKWKSVSLQESFYVDGKLEHQEEEISDEWYIVYEFCKDKTGSETEYFSDGSTIVYSFEWILTEGKLRFIFDSYDANEVRTIESCTKSKLVLSMREEDVYEGVRYKEIQTLTLKKI